MGLFSSFFQRIFSKSTTSTNTVNLTPKCPSCKLELDFFLENEMPAHICPSCKGLWLSPSLFEIVLNEADKEIENISSDGFFSEHTFSRSQSSRQCPVCEIQMDNHQFDRISGIWIDVCPRGHGIWLDHNELKMLRNYRRKSHGASSTDTKNHLVRAFAESSSRTLKHLTRQELEVEEEWLGGSLENQEVLSIDFQIKNGD